MRKNRISVLAGLLGLLAFSSCEKKDDGSTANLNMSFVGLEDLGPDYAYEGWLIVDGSPITAGIFDIDSAGNMSQSSFEINARSLEDATAYVLTIEPSPDPDPSPSKVHILGGDFSGNTAALRVNHSAAIKTNFTSSTGEYILATPTDGDNTQNELSGVWWLNPGSGSAGLNLPTIPIGWRYEGWVVIDGKPVSTGKFSIADGPDDFNGYSGTAASGPQFPGEDFLQNAPNGLIFPLDLSSRTVVISVEPYPDNSPEPFALKPLVGMVPSNASSGMVYTMENNATATNPTGTASR